jgi:hypothetical protein
MFVAKTSALNFDWSFFDTILVTLFICLDNALQYSPDSFQASSSVLDFFFKKKV